MIWALAGLGDEPRAITSVDTSDFYSPTTAGRTITGYKADYTPTALPPPPPVRDENASGPATPPSKSGIEVPILIGAVAVAGLLLAMSYRDEMKANGRRRRRSTSAYIEVHSKMSHKMSGASARAAGKKAYGILKSLGARGTKMTVGKYGHGRNHGWKIEGKIKRSDLSKLKKRLKSVRSPHTVVEI